MSASNEALRETAADSPVMSKEDMDSLLPEEGDEAEDEVEDDSATAATNSSTQPASVHGMPPASDAAARTFTHGNNGVIVPDQNLDEAALFSGNKNGIDNAALFLLCQKYTIKKILRKLAEGHGGVNQLGESAARKRLSVYVDKLVAFGENRYEVLYELNLARKENGTTFRMPNRPAGFVPSARFAARYGTPPAPPATVPTNPIIQLTPGGVLPPSSEGGFRDKHGRPIDS